MISAATKLHHLLLLSLLATGQVLMAQKTGDHESISTAQGLSQGMIFDMLQDQEGFLWIATKEGLNRYDGYRFKTFTHDPGNINSLSSNSIRSLLEDSQGRIWASSLDAGLNVYDKKTGRFKRIVHSPANPNGLTGNRLRTGLVELADGRILLCPDGRALNFIRLPADYFEDEKPAEITHTVLPGNAYAIGIGKDDAGKIWIGSLDNKILLFDPVTNGLELLSGGEKFTDALAHAGKSMWSSSMVYEPAGYKSICLFDSSSKINPGLLSRGVDGKLNLAGVGPFLPGVSNTHYYDIRNFRPGMPAKQGPAAYIYSGSKNDLRTLMLDKSGVLWAGTPGFGLLKYNSPVQTFFHHYPGYSVRNIVNLGDKGLFLAGWGAQKWSSYSGSSLKNPVPDLLGMDRYLHFIMAKNGEYWILQSEQTLIRTNALGKQITTYPILINTDGERPPMMEDSRGLIWLCGANGSLIRVNPDDGKISYFSVNTDAKKPMLKDAISTSFFEDVSGDFWMGTEDGLVRINFRGRQDNPTLTWYKTNPSDIRSLSYNYVSHITADPFNQDLLWVSTKGGGLNLLERSTGHFQRFDTKDGLPNDVVYGLLSDSAGNLWGSTNRGIFCLAANRDRRSGSVSFRNFTRTDGLQGEEFNTDSFLKLPDGSLAFGGVNGLNIFKPGEVLRRNFTPNVFITDILIGNKSVAPGDGTGILDCSIEHSKSITLTHLQDIITLEFSALDFTEPGQNKYRYQLVGMDKDWVESGLRRSATYLHLPAGTYRFRLQGSNSQGIWSDNIAELEIKILPPWWLTWWAYIIYALLAALAVRIYFKFSMNRAKLQSQLNFEQLEARRIKELDTVKTQLYTNITHEFRTPLTVIMGMAKQVINNPDEHFKNGMDMIVRNSQSLLNLVNEMLDLSKLETGKMSLQLVQGDVINFMRYIVESFHSLANSEQKQLHFLTELESLHVAYDPEKIRQIVTNLLSNALKFTEHRGNIYISISKNELPNDEPNLTLILKVKDTGIGIPEDQLQNIFDRFYQLDNSHTRKAEGTGIGLALTKELVKLMEGEIMVRSAISGSNKGSEFTVLLPMVKTAPAKASDARIFVKELSPAPEPARNGRMFIPEPESGSSKPTILLVEDNPDVVAYTSSCLPEYRLAVGTDGREGFDIARELVPDLIITDVMMPFMDGFELCRNLRADEHTSHIPIIMLTAKADVASKLEGLQEGADVYLEKPFHKEELLIRIKKLLEIRQNLQSYYLRKLGFSESTTNGAIPELPTADKKTEDGFVIKVREAVENNIDNPDFTVEQLCKLVFMSHSQLHRKLDALTGCSPNKFIRMIRMNRAKELLKNPANSIASVALDCGFNDPGYFGRVFKQEFGLTAMEWRSN